MWQDFEAEDAWPVLVIGISLVIAAALAALNYRKNLLGIYAETEGQKDVIVRKPTSVNYHFTRQCNYECGFCFHTAKTSFVLPIEEAKRGLMMLKDAGIIAYHCLVH